MTSRTLSDEAMVVLSRPEPRRAYDYWLSKKTGELLPGRAHIEPAEIKAILPRIALVDVVRDQDRLLYRSRLIGTEIARRFGRDITGKFAHDLYSADYLSQINQFYGTAVTGRQPVFLSCQYEISGKAMIYERLILPLAGNGRDVDMLLILFAFDKNKFEWKKPLVPGISKWMAI